MRSRIDQHRRGRERRRRAGSPTKWLTAALLAAGCGQSAPAGEATTTSTVIEPLAFWTDPTGPIGCAAGGSTVQYWSAGATVDFCFTGPGDATNQALVQTTINASWGAAANLNLVWHGACPASIAPSWVSIYLQRLPDNFGGMGSPGKNNRLASSCPAGGIDQADGWNHRADIQMTIAGESDARIRGVAVHEFGHVLGFYHEHDRDDSFHSPAGSPNCQGGELGNATTGWLTKYDPISVMSYCAERYGREPFDWRLSPLDGLGARMMYPPSLGGHTLGCGTNCFNTGTGGAILRTTGTVSSDWTAWGGAQITPQWIVGGSIVSQGESFSPASGALSYQFVDKRSRVHAGGGSVTRSDALHAAIAHTTLHFI